MVYYAAQIGRDRRPTLKELVKGSGMSKRTFGRIAHQITWSGVTIDNASKFLHACGVDALDPEHLMLWLAERKATGKLFEDFGGCRGQGVKMMAQFDLLAARTVMAGEHAG